MIKLSPNTRFSSHIAQGSLSARYKTTENLNRKVFQRMLKLYEKKDLCSISVIKNNYNDILPEKKNIQITQLPLKDYNNCGAGTDVEESKGCITGYSIELPTDKKKKFNISDLSSFMHESTHILDYLLNPKYIANYRQMCIRKIYDKKYFTLYETYFENPRSMFNSDKKQILASAEIETRRKLKKIRSEEKLIFLNFIKYSLEMEYHAYSQDITYAKLLQKLGKPIEKESLFDYNQYMAYPEKIEIINKLIKEEIDKNRLK